MYLYTTNEIISDVYGNNKISIIKKLREAVSNLTLKEAKIVIDELENNGKFYLSEEAFNYFKEYIGNLNESGFYIYMYNDNDNDENVKSHSSEIQDMKQDLKFICYKMIENELYDEAEKIIEVLKEI